MKDSTIIILVVAVVGVLFWAFSKGFITSGAVPIGHTGILAPQPTTNYSGYLAASTAPGVSNALNGLLTGIGGAFTGWFGGGGPGTPAPVVAQGANPKSPTLAAQPQGVSTTSYVIGGSLVGPQPATLSGLQLTYDAGTSGNAFDYAGLAGDNSFDSSYSLESYD